MEILEMVWEFLTFEKVCLAILIYFQWILFFGIDSEREKLEQLIRSMDHRNQTQFDRIHNRLADLSHELWRQNEVLRR